LTKQYAPQTSAAHKEIGFRHAEAPSAASDPEAGKRFSIAGSRAAAATHTLTVAAT
jgi:hypothetical protein